jgi:hypothetical protein
MKLARGFGALVVFVAAASWAASADDLPQRKAGLWQVDMANPGGQMQPQQMKMCIDVNTDAEMYKTGMSAAQGMCSKPEMHRSGDTMTTSSQCKMDQTQITTQAVTKFTGDSAYHSDINSKFSPPMMGHSASTVTQDAKWVGACPADMIPGDVVMGNGMKVNIKQMLGNQKQ